jgi:hypothetical protein
MHRCPHGHLDCFEIQLTGLAAVLKDDPEEFAYFAFDFLPDRFGRFFSVESACLPKVSCGKCFHSSRSTHDSVPDNAENRRSPALLSAAPPGSESSP